MITYDVIVQAAVQPFGSSCRKNENNMDSFSMLIAMNEQEGAGKSYTIDKNLITVTNEHNLDMQQSIWH